jgi:ADP-ribose pyrophosphatase YjhB (NUDIX family)
MDQETQQETRIWLDWAIELQFLAQSGLAYTENPFDAERFERVREIAAEMLSFKSGISRDKVKDLFCNETGYQTPKLDTRAAIVRENKILLVQESRNSTWALPGGWVDVTETLKSNTIKEAKEEAGMDVAPLRLVALLDRNRHNPPRYAYNICKVFMLCELLRGEFKPNLETTDCAFFSLDELPPLSLEKNTQEQIAMCFAASKDDQWQVVFD